MSGTEAPTEVFRDLWLPPVDTAAELAADAPDDHLCLVREEGRTYVRAGGVWLPAGPARPPKAKPGP